jgi:hypothetical protein
MGTRSGLHVEPRFAGTSRLINRLHLHSYTLAFWVVALTCKFCDTFCVGTGGAAVLFPVRRDTVASGTCTFRCCRHGISFFIEGALLHRRSLCKEPADKAAVRTPLWSTLVLAPVDSIASVLPTIRSVLLTLGRDLKAKVNGHRPDPHRNRGGS